MNRELIPLYRLPLGCIAKVRKLYAEGGTRRRLLDMGLIVDTTIEALMESPSGDPIAYRIRGAVIAIRNEEASKILVEMI